MRMLFFVLFCFPSLALAANFQRVEDIKAGSVRGFELREDCERDKSECVQVDGFDFETIKVEPKEVDDLKAPILGVTKTKSCESYEACGAIAYADGFCAKGDMPSVKIDGTEKDPLYFAICTGVTGYAKKTIHEVKVDTVKAAAKAAREEAKQLKASARKVKVDAIKALKNQPKNAVNRNIFIDNLIDLMIEEELDIAVDNLKHKVK